MKDVKPDSLHAWLLAARPKTLAAGSVPVLVASALAGHFGHFQPLPAVLCLLFALLAQIASNFSNDYFDFVKKTDNDQRLGPARAVASGWIAPRSMLIGTALAIALACLFGLGLVYYGGWPMIPLGLVCVLALLAYTAGPWPLAYHGLGDLFVLIFFGLVAVAGSFYVQAGTVEPLIIIAGLIVGLPAVNILVVNNYRDYENDRACQKHTSIVLFGRTFGKWFYLGNGIVAVLLCLLFVRESVWAAGLPLGYLWLHVRSWRKMCALEAGRGLNVLIGETARNLLFLGLLFSGGLLLAG
ncbi:1,4-dihydroxy-2-naphthoate polyprenyltransferase [Pelobacter seleniigenes]|uniref:1,4-dihydroxy-2-naphthoate polyprenyltransferase n=1 Tax=Pelobacter seleniigenes TaxID=407188 RepID=UPI0004A71F9B|nr:1,4-dihydroxy-2-naphthoate polyprenyltransferase [Pelobacter seleniigenes]